MEPYPVPLQVYRYSYRKKKCGTTKEETERTVLEESWRRNGVVGPNLDVTDDDDDGLEDKFCVNIFLCTVWVWLRIKQMYCVLFFRETDE
jgi:hypothetical protein